MRRFLPAAIVAAGMLSGPPIGGAAAGEVEILLEVCSDPETPALDALNACRRVA